MKILFLYTTILYFKFIITADDHCDKNSDDCKQASLSLNSSVTLNDGVIMPLFGLGVYLVTPGPEAESTIIEAFNQGYRLIDTAQIYGNEADVGRAFKKSGLLRSEVFIVSKVFTDAHGYEPAKASVLSSLKKLDMDYVDLFLIHSPEGGKNIETYKALVELKEKGLIRSVGVSNFEVQHLEPLLKSGLATPSVNQFELHVFQRRDRLVAYCKEKGIAIMGYSPLAIGYHFDDSDLVALSEKYRRTPAQIMLRWSVQSGYVTIPKTVNPLRLVENKNIFDFNLSPSDILYLNSKTQFTYGWNTAHYVWEG